MPSPPTTRRPTLEVAVHVFGLAAMAYAGWIFAGQDAFLGSDSLANAMAALGFS